MNLGRYLSSCAILVMVAGGVSPVSQAYGQVPGLSAQVPEMTGQDVVPVFEGWEPNPDGSFEMYFGYMNRNFEETPVIPIGPQNNFTPAEQDRGQPTFFYPRRGMFIFHVRVPKDWGTKELVWTLVSHGKTEKAYGHLLPVYIINNQLISANVHSSSQLDIVDRDQPPVVKIAPVTGTVTLPGTLTLTATITDDGIPKPKQSGRGGRGSQPESTFINDPLPIQARWPPGVNAIWTVYRGPAAVAFSPSGYQAVVAGKDNITLARFSEPGTYVLQLIASDSKLETQQSVTISVVKP
ncbi:MAG TPA: hypothetical protein VG273_19930 [Bryobacteraceae bacterium]|nr:hypothetical protein [Bryobacteraceae bacterium]